MRKSLLFSALLLLPLVALAQDVGKFVTAVETDVNGANLSETPTSDAINMHDGGRVSNQLALELEVTPGTSLVVRVRCYEGALAAKLAPIALCDSAAPVSACKPDIREFTLADYPTEAGKKRIVSRWSVKRKWVACSADDPADGTGTVVMTGTRSWQ